MKFLSNNHTVIRFAKQKKITMKKTMMLVMTAVQLGFDAAAASTDYSG
jgi:hypothetical protein